MAAMLLVVIVYVIVERLRTRFIPLTMFTMRKELHGILFLCMHLVVLWWPFVLPELRYLTQKSHAVHKNVG